MDHRVVAFAASLPLDLRVKDGVGKQILRGLLDRYVPRAMMERPKRGFAIPLADWLRMLRIGRITSVIAAVQSFSVMTS